jgi:hypothetical protein
MTARLWNLVDNPRFMDHLFNQWVLEGSALMPVYRVYILTETDLIADIREIECDDDAAAIAAAEALLPEHPWIEVWYRDRMVRRWIPSGTSHWASDREGVRNGHLPGQFRSCSTLSSRHSQVKS